MLRGSPEPLAAPRQGLEDGVLTSTVDEGVADDGYTLGKGSNIACRSCFVIHEGECASDPRLTDLPMRRIRRMSTVS